MPTEEAFAVLRKTRGTNAARRAVIGAVALLVPALAGCEAGFNAPTLQFHPASNGQHITVDGISVNNLFVLGGPSGSPIPAGGSAGVFLALSNNGTTADSLVGVKAPGVAASVTLDRTVNLAPGASVLLTGPVPDVVLNGLTQPLAGGQVIELELDFARAGAITQIKVPVEPHDFYYDTFSPPAPSPTATPSPTGPAPPAGTATPTTSPSASKPTGTPTPSPTRTK